ncbi:MAG: hypothetical protein WCG01_04115 [bacterium]
MFNKAQSNYQYFGGNLEKLSLREKIDLTTNFFKEKYLKSKEELIEEAKNAEKREQQRLAMPMNQKIRLSLFLKNDYQLSLSIPQSWREKIVVEELNTERAKFIYSTSSQKINIFELSLIPEQASTALKKGEKKIIEKFNQAAVVYIPNYQKQNKIIDSEVQSFRIELGQVLESLQITNNR